MTGERRRLARRRPGGVPGGAVALLLCLLAAVAHGAAAEEAAPFEISPTVSQSLLRLQAGWQRWVTGYYGQDRRDAETAMEEILSIAAYLGMERLPDLSLAAGTYAVRSAREGDFERADWALESARRLDPGRPEVHFAEAEVERRRGSYLAAVRSLLAGYVSLASSPRARTIWLHGLAMWGLYVLLACGVFYLAVLMAARGRYLLDSGLLLLSGPLDRTIAAVVLPLLLLWPLLLPGGFYWLAFYWSVLLWRFLTRQQRLALTAVWLLAAAVPLVLVEQSRWVQVELSRPARMLDRFSEGRLHGTLFRDLETLSTLMPENHALAELKADLYRQLRQWDHAQAQYERLLEAEPRNAAVLVNLGLFFHEKKDYATAMRYFTQALKRNPLLPEAHYNQSQALVSIYDFEGSRPPMSRAQQIAPERVNEWIENDLSGVPVDGGVRRIPEIRKALRKTLSTGEGQGGARRWGRYAGLLVPVVLIALGAGADRLAGGAGLPAGPKPRHRRRPGRSWSRAFVPGLEEVETGRGGRAFLTLLAPTAILLLPLAPSAGYRVPLGFDAGRWFLWSATLLLLLLWAGYRAIRELRE